MSSIRTMVIVLITSLFWSWQSFAEPAQKVFERAYAAFERKDYADAEALFREGLKAQDIEAKLRGLATYYLAESLTRQGKSSTEAASLYQEAMRLIPGTEEAADAAKKAKVEPAGDPPKTLAFLRNGGWDGQVTATKWGGINTSNAWAIGRASKNDLREICRASSEGATCVRRISAEPAIEIFANCHDGVTWQKAFPDRYRLRELLAGTRPDSHRAQSTVASWFEILCPKVWSTRKQ